MKIQCICAARADLYIHRAIAQSLHRIGKLERDMFLVYANKGDDAHKGKVCDGGEIGLDILVVDKNVVYRCECYT